MGRHTERGQDLDPGLDKSRRLIAPASLCPAAVTSLVVSCRLQLLARISPFSLNLFLEGCSVTAAGKATRRLLLPGVVFLVGIGLLPWVVFVVVVGLFWCWDLNPGPLEDSQCP